MSEPANLTLLPCSAPPPDQTGEMRRAVLAGLAARPKRLPCKYFYDEAGSRLFDRICELPEYYPTRCELAILRAHVGEMADLLGPGCCLIEYGSGSAVKTRPLLDRLVAPVAYVPVDVAHVHLLRSSRALARSYPGVEVLPVCADFARPFALPEPKRPPTRRVVYFSGSTISNFGPGEAAELLAAIACLVGPGGGLLIAVDLEKGRAVVEPAYDDSQGVTAAFNLNLLARLNRELGADFDLSRFRHRAVYNAEAGRIEMYLVSEADQAVTVAGRRFAFRTGEAVCTEHSYKFGLAPFATLARRAGLEVERVWLDEAGLFSVQYLRAVP